ncbi:MAG: nitronate monooxygenase [Bdellovibrionaceae bacterium]|nr:nitronate monooxygenase [Bdellovibrionales bacterium]MCB9083323.1 nitronate monooxygenase [Pseudobdellovibrionaceae bacterium]
MNTIPTDFTRLVGCSYPIIGAPMFLVSNVPMVVAVSESGGLGTFPSLNYRPIEEYKKALQEMKAKTSKPIGVNIIVNKSNTRQGEDLKWALEYGVEAFITSLGNPKGVIAEAHKNGAKVFCDVTNLEHALKIQDMGADGVIAVGTGAGGHAGPISPIVLIPWLKEKLSIPIIAAGGIGNGATMAAALALGASAVSVGTRFIASQEAQVDAAYKQAVLDAGPEDIVLTTRVSGTPASVIKTEYIEKTGLDLPWIVHALKKNKVSKKYVVPLIHLMGMKAMEKAAQGPTWKTVWSAGQTVGLIHEILSCEDIVKKLAQEYFATIRGLPGTGSSALLQA